MAWGIRLSPYAIDKKDGHLHVSGDRGVDIHAMEDAVYVHLLDPTTFNANRFWEKDNISHNLSLRPAIVCFLIFFSSYKTSLTKHSILG